MDYKEKLSAASLLIEQHNNQEATVKVNTSNFVQELKALGGTTEESLKECSWEDLEKCGLPRLLARTIAKTFRTDNPSQIFAPSKKRVDAMSIDQLLEAFDPSESENTVGSRLQHLSQNKRFLIFSEDGTILTEPSALLLKELRSGLGELEHYEWKGRVYQVYRVGQRPNQIFDENPMYPGQPLRTGGICGITGFDWSTVPLATRQVIYIAIKDTKELITATPADIHFAQTLATNGAMQPRIPKACVKFNQLQSVNNLPSLKINPERIKEGLGSGRRVL